MKKALLLLLTFCLHLSVFAADKLADSLKINIFENVVYYDGYAARVDMPVKEGLIRTNTTYTRQLTREEITTLTKGQVRMQVDIRAACDNYDRLAYISAFFVEKGKPLDEATKRIELARYITPFMDMNKTPNVRPYVWEMSPIGDMLRNTPLLKKYDVYIQMYVFGVPYAAQKQVKGCEGRNDVFIGNLSFVVYPEVKKQVKDYQFIPVTYQDSLSNYKSTDTLGKTTRTYVFSSPKTLKDVQLRLISSNHGANRGGEEYNRRIHYIYLDDKLIYQYIPGESTCEPYRKYNTQNNGIYGRAPKTDEQWQAFSNWCPGAAIPLREIKGIKLNKGIHRLRISIPDAKFADKEGVIPVSAYFMGR